MTDDINTEKVSEMVKSQYPVDGLDFEDIVDVVISEYEYLKSQSTDAIDKDGDEQ